MAGALVSVVVTVRNEEEHIADLLDSLVHQEPPFEILIVDSSSEDATPQIVESYAARNPEVKLIRHGGTRGESRNAGVATAEGELLAFIDGDCIASQGWLSGLREALLRGDVAAGKTVNIGHKPFARLERVELIHKGSDVTFPSCNLAYRKRVFGELGGFDEHFRTAEDMDLNYRAVDSGHPIRYHDKAVVYNRTRNSVYGFLKQAFWNGYGRKQLTLKHGRLWGSYSLGRMFQRQMSFWGLLRLAAATTGYLTCYALEPRAPYEARSPAEVPNAETQQEGKA